MQVLGMDKHNIVLRMEMDSYVQDEYIICCNGLGRHVLLRHFGGGEFEGTEYEDCDCEILDSFTNNIIVNSHKE